MRWYKRLARILLILSVIDFMLAAPVVVQKRKVHVSGVDDRTDPSGKWWLANAADPIPRSWDSGHWLEQEPRQHNPIDLNDPPEDSGGQHNPIDLNDSPEDSGGPKPLPLWDLNTLPPPSPTGQPPENQLPMGEPSTSKPSTSKPPTSQPPTDDSEPHPLNPSSTNGDVNLDISPQDHGATDNTHALSQSPPHGNADLNLSLSLPEPKTDR